MGLEVGMEVVSGGDYCWRLEVCFVWEERERERVGS